MKRCLTIFAALILLVCVTQPAHALKAIVATIAAGEVKVIGIQAEKKQPIYWEGTQVTTSDKFGLFHFSTTDLPIDCVGQLSDGVSIIDVVVFGCTTEQVVGGGVPRTGQIQSFADGDDGDLQMGVPWPDPRFTDLGDGTVKDNLTGLIWLKDADCFGEQTWFNALSACETLASPACGLTDGSVAGDWRLPNVKELQSLIDICFYEPALPNTAGTGKWSEGNPFTGVLSNSYWSSTTYAQTTYSAWHMYMYIGRANYGVKTEYIGYHVWPVRGGN